MTAPSSVEDVTTGLRSAGYLPGQSTALVSYLAAKLGKPIRHRAAPEVRTGYFKAHIEQDFGDPTHTDPADPDEVRVL